MHLKQSVRRSRVIIVLLLTVSVLAPVLFLSHRSNHLSNLSGNLRIPFPCCLFCMISNGTSRCPFPFSEENGRNNGDCLSVPHWYLLIVFPFHPFEVRKELVEEFSNIVS